MYLLSDWSIPSLGPYFLLSNFPLAWFSKIVPLGEKIRSAYNIDAVGLILGEIPPT